MKDITKHTTRSGNPARKLALLTGLLLLLAVPAAFAQNSKGDKPAAQNPIRLFPKIKSTHKGGDHANTRDISGRRRIRTKNKSSANHVFYPARGPYVNNPSKKPHKTKIYTRTVSGKPIIRRVPNNQQRAWTSNLRGGAIGSASASRSFITRGRKNVYWGKFSKGERPITKDLTGRPVRTRNFHSSPVGAGRSDTLHIKPHKPSRERSRFGKGRGGFLSISGRNGRGWSGDISGHALRSPRTKSGRGRGLFSGGFRSISGRSNNKPLPVRPPGIGANGIGKMFGRNRSKQIFSGAGGGFRGGLQREDLQPSFRNGGGYSGSIRSRRPLRGGGSISGRFFNNRGNPLNVRPPGGSQGVGRFQGNFQREDLAPQLSRAGGNYSGGIKARRPLRGGGSVSGRFFNNAGRPLTVRPPGRSLGIGRFQGNFHRDDLAPQLSRGGAGFSGNMRARRPLKGGGSVSGKFLGNDGKPLAVRPPGSRGMGNFRGRIQREDIAPMIGRQGAGYAGGLRGARRALKGGGSISGKFLSNDGKPIAVRPPGFGSRGAGKFQGNLKASRPLKGGGSVSGQLWNNNEKPLTVRAPLNSDANDYSGSIRLSRFKKSYVRNPNAKKEALKKRKPEPPTYAIGGLGVKARQGATLRNPNSNALALKKIKPGPSTYAIGGLGVKARRPDYVHNPSSSKKALVTLAPGKAYARLKDYQGNMKMTKLSNKRLHPDAQFAHGNKDNVKSERSIKTNIKLIWAKLFKKQGAQPAIVKEKEHVPRYDRKEKDLWKALYD